MTLRPLSTLLVANRGEIARRVFRTARAMGLRCVAVHTAADRDAPFVQDADVAVPLSDGYLAGAAIVQAALSAGADAVHPGYGFLSENADFAEAVVAAGLTWVGPPPDAIRAMGDKIRAKELAAAAGVAVLPSTTDPARAGEVGYPLLVKASAGGGGKGMRVVESADRLEEAVAAARREALAGFGDDRVLLERYVARSRHVEIQLLGDQHGRLVHLGERECSIQRRHQKVIEESPSPVVDPDLREAMGGAALALGRSLGYHSAGTVEFLLDDDTRDFFFLEVNTRLQVEHPVTELVTGLDLVREQLRVAEGHPLGVRQEDVRLEGHAIEARLYAEDPARGFLPSTGALVAFLPAAEPAVRWDTGVREGSVVGLEYDPMLAKVSAHGASRDEAARRLALSLERLHVGGVTTNVRFLAATLRHPEFLAGRTTTDFIDRVGPATLDALSGEEARWLAVAAALWLQAENRRTTPLLRALPSGWRNGRMPAQQVALTIGPADHLVIYEQSRDGSFTTSAGPATVHAADHRCIDVELASRRAVVAVTRAGDLLLLQAAGGTVAARLHPRFPEPESAAVVGALSAPMPGVVSAVRVAEGDKVEARQVLVILEAMKMEHHVTAPGAGTVAELRARTGDQVATGQLLLVLDTVP